MGELFWVGVKNGAHFQMIGEENVYWVKKGTVFD